jgi:hypothetical protein
MDENKEKIDYEELFRTNMSAVRDLYYLSDEDKKIMAKLLEKKKQIMEKNGFFANFQLDRINNKIYKIKAKYKEK